MNADARKPSQAGGEIEGVGVKIEVNHTTLDSMKIDHLNFSPYDLRANREGYLTKEQRAYLAQERKTAYDWIYVLSAIFYGAAIVFLAIGLVPTPLMDRATSWVIALVAAIFGSIFNLGNYPNWKRLQADLLKGNVSAVKGKIKLHRDETPAQGERSATVRYSLIIGTLTAELSEDVFYAFDDGKPYCIYFLPNSRLFLSCEPDYDNWGRP